MHCPQNAEEREAAFKCHERRGFHRAVCFGEPQGLRDEGDYISCQDET